MGMSLSFSKETVFSQFTGFHDKEGKEIYEGDIFGNKMLRCHVEQEVGGAWIVVFADKKLGKMKLINDTVLKSSVVGNIFENPELLTP